MNLHRYRRDFAPDRDVAPREPVYAKHLVSVAGASFVLVRESIGEDHVGRMVAWLVWRGRECVGYVGATLSGDRDPFNDGSKIVSRRALNVFRAVNVWRSHLVDGSGRGTAADVLSRLPSRGLGIMTASYVEIVRQLSSSGWALASQPAARSPDARRLWRRLRETRGVETVRSRSQFAKRREFAFILARNLPKR